MVTPKIKLTEVNSSHRVFVDGVEVSQATTTREAVERAINEALGNPTKLVNYEHVYNLSVQTESVKPPDPPIPPKPTDRKLIGGWRFPENEFCRGSIAIDFATGRLWMVGHAQQRQVYEYQLPAMGGGGHWPDYPMVQRSKTIEQWWSNPDSPDQSEYAAGLLWYQGKLWMMPRVFYDMVAPSRTYMMATDGERRWIDLPRQQYAGFVKRGPGLDPLLGCGGYESGQGASFGPTLATFGGMSLIHHGWDSAWDAREDRPGEYEVDTGIDEWYGMLPRDGKYKWGSDTVYGGGLVLPEGVCYWPTLGTGFLSYRFQTLCFTNTWKTAEYTYDKNTYKLLGFKETDLEKIGGQEIDAQGRIYLQEDNYYSITPRVKVFG